MGFPLEVRERECEKDQSSDWFLTNVLLECDKGELDGLVFKRAAMVLVVCKFHTHRMTARDLFRMFECTLCSPMLYFQVDCHSDEVTSIGRVHSWQS